MKQQIRNIADLDRVIHEPGRLMIVALLFAVEEADFLYLLYETGINKGTLSSHISRLEEAGYPVRRVLALVDREEGGAEQFAAAGHRLEALYRKRDFPVGAGWGVGSWRWSRCWACSAAPGRTGATGAPRSTTGCARPGPGRARSWTSSSCR